MRGEGWHRLWSAFKLIVLAVTLALVIAGTVVAAAAGVAALAQAAGGGASAWAQLERYRSWAQGAEVVGVVGLGSVLGLVWSRRAGIDTGGRR